MRLFIAVAADEEVQAAAAAVVGRLRRAAEDYRWVDPRDMHVTLRFLGEVSERERREVEALMFRVAAETPPFDVVYGRLGAFESFDDPRVVWIGLEEGLEPLEKLSLRLGRDEPRPFAPHLTLGRRRQRSSPDLPEIFRRASPLSLRRRVEKISLYASRPAPFGHAYDILLQAPLASA